VLTSRGTLEAPLPWQGFGGFEGRASLRRIGAVQVAPGELGCTGREEARRFVERHGSLTLPACLSNWEPVTARPSRSAAAPRKRRRPHLPSRLRWVALAQLATACAQDMTVFARMGDRPPNPDALAAASPSRAAFVAAGITIDRFRIVLRDIRLESENTQNGEHTAGEAVIGPGPVLLDVSGESLDPGAMTQIVSAAHVAWKSYYEVDLDLRPVTQDEVDANPTLAPLLGRTFLIEGRAPGGAPFTIESSLVQVLVRPAVFRNGTNHNNVTINIAPNRWFVGADGAGLDPGSADPAVRAAIQANVAASIDGYMDDNRDGNPDSLG